MTVSGDLRQFMVRMIQEQTIEVAARTMSEDAFLNTIVAKLQGVSKQGGQV